MGNTGDAEGTPTHLHFEVHPVSLLYLGYDGAIDPTPYLARLAAAPEAVRPDRHRLGAQGAGHDPAPQPGAILIGSTDISSADGLDPSTLRRLAPAPGHA